MSTKSTSSRPAVDSTAEAADRAATAAVEAAPEPAARRPFMSAGVAADLELWGKATDPATGAVFERDRETGKVTHTDRSGNVTRL